MLRESPWKMARTQNSSMSDARPRSPVEASQASAIIGLSVCAAQPAIEFCVDAYPCPAGQQYTPRDCTYVTRSASSAGAKGGCTAYGITHDHSQGRPGGGWSREVAAAEPTGFNVACGWAPTRTSAPAGARVASRCKS